MRDSDCAVTQRRIDKRRNTRDTIVCILGGTLVGIGVDYELATAALTGLGIVFACLVLLATRNG